MPVFLYLQINGDFHLDAKASDEKKPARAESADGFFLTDYFEAAGAEAAGASAAGAAAGAAASAAGAAGAAASAAGAAGAAAGAASGATTGAGVTVVSSFFEQAVRAATASRETISRDFFMNFP